MDSTLPIRTLNHVNSELPKKNLSLSIIVPVYNEEEIVESSVLKNINIASKNNIEYEIIVINDGSTDNSGQIIDNLASKYHIRVVHHSENNGFGAAIKSGISLAEKDYVICVPTDSPLEQEHYQVFEENLGDADVLISYRIKRLGYTWWMQLNSIVYHFLISKLFSMNLKDYNWIHLYHNKLFKNQGISIEYDGVFMLAEVLIKAKQNHSTFKEVPIHQTQRTTGAASAAKPRVIIKTIRDLLHFYFFRYSKNTKHSRH